ncbi:AsmA family protein [Maridesulfovibrio hydrothermalis]|uniref:Putative AsmA family protein n=1 Tax=Maridesulfovibrio hydrothermalis AM13 = DSM 14728 TaxID=1121451 RepID=L0RIG9_9BACT|nr:AsmA family protein [Maridesulfovibrio hydrothermalis]CCO25391.1 putative AsmA family protein [Maridesulfovibrio hydrothermalis AM13 = DSM 14728]
MSKAAKIIISTAVGLVVVVVAVMVLVTVFIDPNDYKEEISKAVRDKTGRELVFDGDLQLSVFPWIGVTTQGVSLSNAPGFAEKNMFSLKSANVSVKLLPLISGDIELRNIEVAELQLFLMRNKKGVTNWDDLTGEPKASKVSKEENTAEKGKKELNLSVGGINIQNAKVVWDDRMKNVRHAVNDCDITVDEFAPDSPFKFNIHVEFSSTEPEINADITTYGQAEVSSDFKQLSVKGLSVVVDATGQAVPGGKGQVKLSGDAVVDMLKGGADVAGLVVEAYGMKAEGSLNASGFESKSLSFSGDINVPGFNLKSTLDQMGMAVKTADSKALNSVGMNFNFAGTSNSAEIKDLLINLDETTIKGFFSFADPERPNIVAQVNVDKLNLDRYLPPAEEKKAENKNAKEVKPEAAKAKQELLPVDLLRKLTLKADLNAKQLIAGKAKLNDVVVRMRAKGGVLTVKPASLNAAKGAFTSRAMVDVRGRKPVMSVAASLTGLDGAVLSQEMTGKDSFSGRMNFNTDLKTSGNDMKAVYANLGGNLGFKVSDGYVSGFDILYLAGDAFSILTGGALGKRDSKRTEFGEVSATATIKKGVAVNKNLLLQSPLLRGAGKGTLDLNTMTIDYGLDTKIVGSLEGQGGKGMKDLVGLTVPVTIKGTVADPEIMVDLPRFATILAGSGFHIAGSVIEGVGDVIQGIGNTITGRKGSKTKTDEKDNSVQKLGGVIKNLF